MFCLDGTLVLDLNRRFPGAYTAMFLGDFGAEVIKVDPLEAVGLPPRKNEERYAAFHPFDRNKRSIKLDLKKEAGRKVLNRLVERADVLVEGFRPGVMDRLGAGYDQLSTINPRLIYCSLSGFGQTGPYAQYPGHDMVYTALGGAMSLIGERGRRPVIPSNIIADFAGAGLHGLIGILLALLAREKTGKGQMVDVSYLDAVISLLPLTTSAYFATGSVGKRGETPLTGAAPWAQVYQCKDGEYVTTGAGEPHLWANFCRALGREDFIPDVYPRDRERADYVISEFQKVFLTRTRDEWWEYLKDKNCGVAPVYYINETLKDPQVLHRGMVVELEHPNVGKVKQAGIPIKLSDTPGKVRQLGVATGSDTDAVLAELGYTAPEIAELREQHAAG